MVTESWSLEVSAVSKSYESGTRSVEVLHDISFALEAPVSLAIVGPSGSGKSTLLHLLGTLDKPSQGSIFVNGASPFELSEPKLARFRNRNIGFVFQDHHLLPQYSVLENVLLPTMADNPSRPRDRQRAKQLLERVGLSHRLDHRPGELSGGERQRAAVARALINCPGILLCDEPTGNLDTGTADTVADLLFELHRAERNILVVVTHSMELARLCDRCLLLRDGSCSEL